MKMILFIFTEFLSNLWITSASIAGITYMDNFDFDQRYENTNECNPLHWHPLHLPNHCVEMFEAAILSRVKSDMPIPVVKKHKGKRIKIYSPYFVSPSYAAEVPQAPIRTETSYYGHPFGKMLELLSKDVNDHPRAPTVGFLPNVGLVALYQQPVSRKSEKMIKKVATIYAPDISYNEPQYSPFSMNMPWINKSAEQNDITELTTNKTKKRRKVIKKKIKNGSAVAILEKKIYK